MFTFLKAQAGSLTASFVDFAVTIFLVEWLHCWFLTGTIIGTATGGIVYFLLGRFWVFDAAAKSVRTQMIRYLIVWTGYLALNPGLVFLVTQYGAVNYIVSKTGVSILLGIGYNYLLQKKFVFR